MSQPTKKRSKKSQLLEVSLTEIQTLLNEMHTAAVEDVECFNADKPALHKVKLLPKVKTLALRSDCHNDLIDNGFLKNCANWLAPLP
ncbi:hypothetical protein GEMRC1_012156 [Eukaryota sp. GEM-RC1]